MVFVLGVLRFTLTSRQNDGEGLQDYTRQFNMSTEILEYHLGGPLILEKYVNTTEGYNENDPRKTIKIVKQAS